MVYPTGKCRKCKCTDNKCCDTPDGPCRWVNYRENKCSGCFTDLGNPRTGFVYGRPKKSRRPGKRS